MPSTQRSQRAAWQPPLFGKQGDVVYVLTTMDVGRKRDGWALVGSGGLHIALAVFAWHQLARPLPRPAPPRRPTEITFASLGPLPRSLQSDARPAPALPTRPTLAPVVDWPPPPPPLPKPVVDRPPPPVPKPQPVPSPDRVPPPEPPKVPKVTQETDGAPPRLAANGRPAAVGTLAPSPARGAPGAEGSPSGAGVPTTGTGTQGLPPGRIDLFPSATLCKTVGCSDGKPGDPGAAARASLAQQQAEREGVEAVRSGRVDPMWRQVERDVETAFAPPEKSVSSASRGELALRQLVRPVTPAPDKTETGWLVRRDNMERLQAEIRAAHDAYDEAAVGREAEVEAEIDEHGEVLAVRLVVRSGNHKYDAEAVRAVQKALRLRPLPDPQGAVIARYALRGELAVNLPRIGSAVEPNGGQVHAQTLSIAGTFDEVTGKANVRIPFLKRLKKTIRLLSVRRRIPAQ